MENIMEEMIKLELTVSEINKILNALGDKPFAQVVDLITNIQRQGKSQLEQEEEN